jgi:hypothetical protein
MAGGTTMVDLPADPQIWAYGRVSSLEQAENTHALEHQLARLAAAGVPAERILYDVESGAKVDRAKFTKLLSLVRAGQVKVIVATRWDRLMRNGMVYQEFKESVQCWGVDIRLLDQGPVDFNQTPCVCVLAERPDNYRHLYHDAEDSKRLAGLSKADIARDVVESFLRLRQKRATLRYLREKYGVPKRKCYELVTRADGSTKKTMIRKSIVFLDELDFWSSGKDLGDWLGNPVLVGDTAVLKYTSRDTKQRRKAPSEWEIYPETHTAERLVSPEEFAEIQSALQLCAKRMGPPGATFYLTGLVVCGHCQTKSVLKSGPRYKYYGCRHASAGCNNRRCVRLETIDEAIINQLFTYAHAPSHRLLQEQEQQQRQAALARLQEQLQGLHAMPGLHSTPALLQAQQQLQHQMDDLRDFKEPKFTPDSPALQIIRHSQARNLNFWYTLTQDERALIYPKLVERVVLFADAPPTVTLKSFPELQFDPALPEVAHHD